MSSAMELKMILRCKQQMRAIHIVYTPWFPEPESIIFLGSHVGIPQSNIILHLLYSTCFFSDKAVNLHSWYFTEKSQFTLREHMQRI